MMKRRVKYKDNLQMWVLTEFPELFYGYHNWIINTLNIKNS